MNLAFTHSTGLYYFIDTNIPAAVFLGLHLLVTDPATSPRKNFGKIVFGSLYGVAVFGLYWLLGWLGAPTFYDKLLCVPPLNLTVRWLDRVSQALAAKVRIPSWTPRLENFAHMGVWVCLFAVMYTTGFLGAHNPGADPEFWRKACANGRGSACQTWVRMMNVTCSHGSGTASRMLASLDCRTAAAVCSAWQAKAMGSIFKKRAIEGTARVAFCSGRCISPEAAFLKTRPAHSLCSSNPARMVGGGDAADSANATAPGRAHRLITAGRSKSSTKHAEGGLLPVVFRRPRCTED
jgi:hypothetical protein